MDILSIISQISTGISSATNIAKFIKDSGSSLEKAEVKLKLADLIEALAETRIKVAEIKNLLIEKDEEIKNLTKTIETSKNIKWKQPYYYIDNDGTEDGPYCQNCYDSDRKAIRVQKISDGHCQCFTCNKTYRDSDYTPPPVKPPNRIKVMGSRKW